MRNSGDQSLVRLSPIDEKRLVEIESERNTWKLIYSLYKVCDLVMIVSFC